MIKRLLLLFTICVVFSGEVSAQELQARVQILSPQVQATNKRALAMLQLAMTDFLNNKQWSKHNVHPEERIDCNFVVTIKEWDGSSNFKAEAQIISTRPIYNSPILTLSDRDFDFNYTAGEPLDFSDQQYLSNLTSLLAYYAYLIIGLDADTFSLNGGASFYQSAQNVLNNAQNSNFTGWKSIEGFSNRFWLISNMHDSNYQSLHNFAYRYHIQVLDKMADNQQLPRKEILNLLPLLTQVDRMAQGALYNQLFYTAKAEELIGIISGLPSPERVKAINLLSAADPANINKYEN
ncbi:DUF4835 family protein [Olivibacter sp. SDN3]|uniref:type IX secretion system protein PorD n=1 Tax=Olivibacter sp. SDN3 TaxID=2764720 RepID=UPI001650FD9C|nr:DUF4835 family protein [Olivibacter sp. SDN3]QNL50417.1 DUF4835 family protein [Olivibacter sp. SDN3]